MLSSTAEAALRATVTLARIEPEARTVELLAQETEVPAAYLSKILQMLGRARVVQSRPGRGGGFTLRAPAEEISAWDVIQAVDPWTKIDHCPLNDARCESLCPLHTRLLEAFESAERALRAASLRDLARPRAAGAAIPSPSRPFDPSRPTAVPKPKNPDEEVKS
jgi:Rrf2 family protein